MGLSWVTGAEPILDDLLLGVLACASSHSKFQEDVRNGGIDRAMVAWGRRLSGGRWGAAKRWFRRVVLRQFIYPNEIIGFDFETECAAFQRYLDEHGVNGVSRNDWSAPVFELTGEGEGVPLKSPWPLVLLNSVTAGNVMTRHEALTRPMPAVRWEQAIDSERRGKVRLIDIWELREDQRQANENSARKSA